MQTKGERVKIIDGETTREVKTKKIKEENDDFKRAVGEACWSHQVGREKIKLLECQSKFLELRYPLVHK